MADKPQCELHMQLFFWAMGLVVTALTILTTNVVANDRRAIDSEKELYEKLTSHQEWGSKEHTQFRMEMSKLSQEILQRLTRIESRECK